MPFLSVTIDLEDLDADTVEHACFEAGALAVTFTDRRDDAILEPAPGEFRLWPATRLCATFDATHSSVGLLRALAAKLGIDVTKLGVEAVADRAWEREWLRDFHAMRFGQRLWIAPSHEPVHDPAAIVVTLDPGLAFGTGTHPTTASCLEWLDAHAPAGASVIDYGCGSGVLAIAAAKLGARVVHAFDIDPQALTATRDNAATNDVADRLRVVESAADLPQGADIVLANILSGPLCDLAPTFARLVRAGGTLVLAGMLESQADEVAAAQRAWFHMAPFRSRDGWVCLAGPRRSEVGSA